MNRKKLTRIALLLTLALILGGSTLCLAMEKPYIVGFKQPPGQTEKDKIRSHGGKIKHQFKIIKAMAVSLSEDAKGKLKADPKVAYIEEDIPISVVEPMAGGIEYENAWNVSRIGSYTAHANGNLGTGVKVAVLDTGIDYTHPDLDENYFGGYDFVYDDNDPFDDSYNSHGTHVAGIIGAELNGTGVVGVAPEAALYAIKVLDGAGFGQMSWLLSGIEWAVLNGMQVANMSIGITEDQCWNHPDYNCQSLEDVCNAAYNAGMLLVAAAGNNYGGNVIYPARLESVIAVGATTVDDTLAGFSSIGLEIELVAPSFYDGTIIGYKTDGSPIYKAIYSTISGGGYGHLYGTSQASPHVVGVAALLMTAGVDDLNLDGIVDQKDVRQQMQETALDLGDPGWDPLFGFGLVQAPADASPPQVVTVVVDREKGGIKNSYETIVLENGIFDLHIVNNSLANLTMEVLVDGYFLDGMPESIKFGKKEPQKVFRTIDASGRSLKVVFIPDGKPGSFATVEAVAIQ